VRARLVLVTGVGIPVLVALLFVYLVAGYDGRQDIDLRGFLGDTAWERQMLPGAHLATEEICDDDLPCIQAVEAETLTMLRFARQEQAAAAAERYGDQAYLNGWIVVRFAPGALTADQRREFQGVLACTHVMVGQEGQDC
jgi:hypothetical protein